MEDELARAIVEHKEARRELRRFLDKHLGNPKVWTFELLERWRKVRERDEKAYERMLDLFHEKRGEPSVS